MIKYVINERCYNNQAEKIAILKALEKVQHMQTHERTALVSTNARIIPEPLKNKKNDTTYRKNKGRK